MSGEKKIRVLIAKPGLDGHDQGAKVIALALRDAGFETIYTGLHKSVEQIVRAAVDEDVDVIGISILSGAHIPTAQKLFDLLKAEGRTDAVVIFGGNIPKRDHEKLKDIGVDAVFQTGSKFDDIADFIRTNAPKKRGGS
jgi:methylmalonyl-CoA mutase C-terminal domain/subunit